MSINRGMDRDDVVHAYNGILLSHKEEGNWVICRDLDESRECHAGWSNSEKEKQILYINMYTWNLEKWYQFSSVTQLCLTLCDPMNHSTPGLPVHHQLPESTQTHVHWVGDAIQPFHPLLSPSLPALYLSQHQGLFQWVSSSHQVAKALEFQLQHHSFQWIPRTDLL